MSDSSISHVRPVAGAGSVQYVRAEHAPGYAADANQPESTPAAATGGSLRAAYAQFVVDVSTREVIVRIRDASTDEVISELPSKDVQAMTRHLREYTEALARHRAALAAGK